MGFFWSFTPQFNPVQGGYLNLFWTGVAEMLLFWASAVLVFVWRQNYNQPISGMAAFSAVHARAFLPSNPHPALLISPRTGSTKSSGGPISHFRWPDWLALLTAAFGTDAHAAVQSPPQIDSIDK